MRNLTVLKLGGSAITDKTRELTPDLLTINRSADQLAKFTQHQPLILLHGGGSFAHPFADKARLQDGFTSHSQLVAFTETELYLEQLSRIIMVALLQRGVPTVRVHPLSCIETKNRKVSRAFIEPFENALKLGIVPVSHGDIVFDREKQFSILSADRLAVLLGIRLGASKVLFGSDVDGVYSKDPKTSKESDLVREVTRSNVKEVTALFEKTSTGRGRDVTGGMSGKVSEALELAKSGCETVIFNLKREGMLEKLLSTSPKDLDENVSCTLFRAWHHEIRHSPRS